MINVSDDDDLLSAYEVAQKDLSGNLKLVVKFKSQPVEETSVKETKVKKPKKTAGEEKKKKATKDSKKKAKKIELPKDEGNFSEDQVLRDRAKTLDQP